MPQRPSQVVQVETIGEYQMRVVRFREDGKVGVVLDEILDPVMDSVGRIVRDLLGWGVDTTKPRWLVEVCGGPIKGTRTVRTRSTRLGARRAASQIRTILSEGDPQAVETLPDLSPRTGFSW